MAYCMIANSLLMLLRRHGAIRYHRGRLSVLDRSALEGRAGECYERRTRRNELEDLALL